MDRANARPADSDYLIFREDGSLYGASPGAASWIASHGASIRDAVLSMYGGAAGSTLSIGRSIAALAAIEGEDGRLVVVRIRKDWLVPKLSRVESRVATLLLEGLTANAVAARLRIGFTTVRSHIRSIYRKLDVASRVELLEALRNQEARPVNPPVSSRGRRGK